MVSKTGLFENVLGIKKVLPEVTQHIGTELPGYELAIAPVNPQLAFDHLWICGFGLSVFVFVDLLGVNMDWERLYFFLVHRAYLAETVGSLGESVKQTLEEIWDLHREDFMVRDSDSCGVGPYAMSISSVGGGASSYMMMRRAPATPRRHVRTCYVRFMSGLRFHELTKTVSLNQADKKQKVYKIHLKWCPYSVNEVNEFQLAQRPKKNEPKWRHIHWDYMAPCFCCNSRLKALFLFLAQR